MRQHLRISPIADIIRNTYALLIPGTQAIAHISRSNGFPLLHRLRQQPAMKFQQLTPIGRRALGKKYNRQTRLCRCPHPASRSSSRAAMSSRHIDGSRHGRHPANHRPFRNFRLRYEDTRMKRRKDHNIQIAQMVRDYRSPFGELTLHLDLDSKSANRARGKMVQPVGPGFARRGMLHQ